jgi:hypothetical protein
LSFSIVAGIFTGAQVLCFGIEKGGLLKQPACFQSVADKPGEEWLFLAFGVFRLRWHDQGDTIRMRRPNNANAASGFRGYSSILLQASVMICKANAMLLSLCGTGQYFNRQIESKFWGPGPGAMGSGLGFPVDTGLRALVGSCAGTGLDFWKATWQAGPLRGGGELAGWRLRGW